METIKNVILIQSNDMPRSKYLSFTFARITTTIFDNRLKSDERVNYSTIIDSPKFFGPLANSMRSEYGTEFCMMDVELLDV